MPSNQSEGSTTTDGTTQTLFTVTTAGNYQFVIDTSNMANGDKVEVEISIKVRTGDSSTLVDKAIFEHAQGIKVKTFRPLAIVNEIVVTLERTAGTDRAYSWALIEL